MLYIRSVTAQSTFHTGLMADKKGLQSCERGNSALRIRAVCRQMGIENFNRQLRKVSKNRSVFPNDDSLLKMLYLAQVDITGKWTGRRRDWGEIHSQLEIFFADRLPE